VAHERAIDEVTGCFAAYERALLANDVEAMDGWFARDPAVVRFGIAERQHGFDEIAAWRRDATPVPHDRRHLRTTFTPAGDDVVVVALEFANGDASEVGRQSQVWARSPVGWRIVHAHVSVEAPGLG
jgi:ketosteroid isomerase-like protein